MVGLEILESDDDGSEVYWRLHGIDGVSRIERHEARSAEVCEPELRLARGVDQEIMEAVTDWIEERLYD